MPCKTFRNMATFYGEELLACSPPRPPQSWRSTHRRLSATADSMYSQLPSILKAVPTAATGGRAMLWLQVSSDK